MREFLGKKAVVTGASSGIGRAIVLRFAAAGADCLIHAGRNERAAREVAGEIEQMGRASHVVIADLAQEAEQDRLVESALGWSDTIDIWVNNAGVDVLTGDAADASFEEKLQRLWLVDGIATMRMARAIGARMKSAGAGGVLLNMGWDQAAIGMAGDSGEMFAAIKGAVIAFTRSLAKSLAPEVRVHCLAPGWIQTKWGCDASPYWQDRARDESLLHRWGTPEDVADAALFLASPAASFMTGQVMTINGGRRDA